MAGTLTVDTIQSDSSYTSTLNVASKINFSAGMQIGGQDATFGGMRNRIINGAMMIDQRNAGASVAVPNSYALDRWVVTTGSIGSSHTIQRVTDTSTGPSGFINSMKFTVGTGASPTSTQQSLIYQPIEGFNVADMDFGKSTAKTFTVSFWVKSSLTGTFTASILNASGSRSYVFTYTISSANTWEQKTATVAGDLSGTWSTDNGVGLFLVFNLGVGSNYQTTANAWQAGDFKAVSGATNVIATSGATWSVTGVQLEKGSSATSFEQRLYGQELALCQRYYQTTYNTGVVPGTITNTGAVARTLDATQNYPSLMWSFPVKMRATPSMTYYSPATGASGKAAMNSGDVTATNFGYTGMSGDALYLNGITVGAQYYFVAHFVASAEL